MRHLALVVVTCALLGARIAMAAGPFDNLSSRLKQYDESRSITQQSSERGSVTRQLKQYDSGQPVSAQSRRVEAPRQVQTSGPEEIPHGPQDSPFRDDSPDDHAYADSYADAYDPYCADDDGCCDWPCDYCCGPRVWGNFEYLYWWLRGSSTPPLVTTSPDNTPQASAGILPQATVLFGGERLNTTGRSGGRFSGGYWFDPCGTFGIESSTFFLGDVDQVFDAASGGTPILARPFFNVNPETGAPREDASPIAFPNVVIGNINVASTSRVVGTEVNLRKMCSLNCGRRVDLIAGWRFFQLSEGLNITSMTTVIDQTRVDPPFPGTMFLTHDGFATRNTFNGGQIGINAQYGGCCWTLDLLAKIAFGGVTQHVAISGNTLISPPGEVPFDNAGGILALPSNIGSYQRTRFAVLPEFGVTLRRQISPCWRANIGYSLLILSNVVRPGDQIDVRVDPVQIPPPIGTGIFPKFTFNDSDVWVQGINVGFERNF